MTKDFIGSIYILISSLLFSTRYIVASHVFVKYDEYSDVIYEQILRDNTFILLELSIVSLVIGIIYIIRGFLEKKHD
ncbi:MAG: hypothetical protein K2P09_04440 [Erysipelotrichales bacterium]|nr:hypothetical protein [Erysipelotrichales bacterium]